MSGAEKITLWLAQLRASGTATFVARGALAAAGAVALVVPGLQSWDQMDLVPILGAFLLVISVLLPDSAAPLCFLVVVTAGWLFRATGDLTLGLVITGIAVLVAHLAAAFAGQIPSYARVSRSALRRWLLPATIALLLGPIVAIAAAGVRGAAVPGSLLVTVAALAAATAAIWFAAGQSLGDR
ncbi:hypothetical protein GCM10009789_07480 [Kribbella sancticallisti]|uniref:Uncharacterized protein n=1 Tax=Kribbella sancticallisti TaxID=460087 RepID=A0ABP4N934_9ACTN